MTNEELNHEPDPILDGDSEQALPAIPSTSESVRAQPANRTFFSAVLIIAFIFLFGLLAIFFVLFNGGFGPTQAARAAVVAATNASVSMNATQTQMASQAADPAKAAPTKTPTGFVPSPTLESIFPTYTQPAPTKTPVAVAQASTATPTNQPTTQPTNPPTITPVVAVATTTPVTGATSVGSFARTATVSAFLTQSARPTSTALPQTGFFDEGGLPGMVVIALGLLGVIVFARRTRLAS